MLTETSTIEWILVGFGVVLTMLAAAVFIAIIWMTRKAK